MKFQLFAAFQNLKYGLSEKPDGSMKLAYLPDKDRHILQNRQSFFARHGVDSGATVIARLTHGDHIVRIGRKQAGSIIPESDGLITNEPNVYLTVTVADCVPIYFFDPQRQVVGLVHGGWRNIVLGVAVKAIRLMGLEFGCRPEDILCGLGPCIQSCHYEVKEDIAERFSEYPGSITREGSRFFVDLHAALQEQLVKAGILSGHCQRTAECTFEHPARYFSYRRDHPSSVEAMIAYIGRFA